MRLLISGTLLLSTQYINIINNCGINATMQHAWPDVEPTTEGKLPAQRNQIIDITGNSPQSTICRVQLVHPKLTLAATSLMA